MMRQEIERAPPNDERWIVETSMYKFTRAEFGIALSPIQVQSGSITSMLSRRTGMSLPPVLLVVVVVMVVVPFLVHPLRFDGGNIADDQFAAVAHAFSHSVSLRSVSHRFVHRVLSAQRRLYACLTACWAVQILPSLAVIPVESSSALGAWRIIRRHRVAVWRRPVAVVSGTSISEGTKLG